MREYCTANRKRKHQLSRHQISCSCILQGILVAVHVVRRDKYERHLREFWVDVETVGTLAKSMEEEITQSYEIVDFNCSLPVPTLGDSPKPWVDEPRDESPEHEADEGSSSEEDAEAEHVSKKKPSKSKPASSPKTRRKQNRRKAEQVEEALEAPCIPKTYA